MQAEAPGHPVSTSYEICQNLGAANNAVTVHSADARRGDHDMGATERSVADVLCHHPHARTEFTQPHLGPKRCLAATAACRSN